MDHSPYLKIKNCENYRINIGEIDDVELAKNFKIWQQSNICKRKKFLGFIELTISVLL